MAEPPLVERSLAALDRAGVRWCLLRGAYPDPIFEGSEDLDVLVDRRDLPRADALLRGLGFGRIPTWGRGGHCFYLAYDRTFDRWLKLDLDTEISFGPWEELPTTVEEGFLARRASAGAWWRLDPDDAFWALLLHALLDKGEFRREHRRELAFLVERANDRGPLASWLESLGLPAAPARRMREAVRAERWDELLSSAPAVARRWRARTLGFVARRTLLDGARRRATKLLTLMRRRGLSVALLGPDGAGKSTLAEGIRASFYFPVRNVYMGLYRPGNGAPSSTGLGLGYRLAKQWQRVLGATFHQSRGRLVVFDRHGHDQRLPSEVQREPVRSRVRRWLLAHAFPPPDMAFVLDAPGEVLFARKGEHSVAYLESQRQKFRTLAQRLHNVEIVDVTRDPDEVRRDVVERIWRLYAARWS